MTNAPSKNEKSCIAGTISSRRSRRSIGVSGNFPANGNADVATHSPWKKYAESPTGIGVFG